MEVANQPHISFPNIWNNRLFELNSLAEPLIESLAFKRLDKTTFLGILSPKFHSHVRSPLYVDINKDNSKEKKDSYLNKDDGTRKDHSMDVAILFLDMVSSLGLKESTYKYAVAWGLVHDIATWPLSHTGEAAFSELLGISGKKLRTQMILGDKSLPSDLSVRSALSEIGVIPNKLLELFDKEPTGISKDLIPLWEIVHSPLTPDSLEGIWRSGRVLGIDVPTPDKVINAISKSLFGTIVSKSSSSSVLDFWRRKSELYKKTINRPCIIRLESSWSFALEKYYRDSSLFDTLHFSESEIVNELSTRGIPSSNSIKRYKHPLIYYVEPSRKKKFDSDQPLLSLRDVLRKKIMKESGIKWNQQNEFLLKGQG
ncbi:MAG: hypothetical protein AB2651_21425 [Candidatus Thiodiazotropha sp.]